MYHNRCFRGEIRKILCGYPLLSVAMYLQQIMKGLSIVTTEKKLKEECFILINLKFGGVQHASKVGCIMGLT